jgi:hypothetical protein
MRSELKLPGGPVVNLMIHHPAGAVVGALVLAAPCTWIAGSAAGTAAGMVMGIVGLLMGAPLGAMLAESASRDST